MMATTTVGVGAGAHALFTCERPRAGRRAVTCAGWSPQSSSSSSSSSRVAARGPHAVRSEETMTDAVEAKAAAPSGASAPRRTVLTGVAASVTVGFGLGAGPKGPAPITAWAEEEGAVAAAADAAAAAQQEGAILVTGANSGVGFSAAKLMAAQGKRIVLACRTEQKGLTAAAAIREKVPDAKLDVIKGFGLEMTDLRSTSDYVKAFQDSGIPLDVLVLNAGIMAVPLGRTEQDHELHFGVNHLAHFLIQDGLVPQLRQTQERTGERGRLVTCSSIANTLGDLALDLTDLDWRRRGYNEWTAYCASKAANVLLSDEVARREPTIASNSFHPGIVTTNLVRYILPELTAENRDPEAERLTANGKLIKKLGIRDADEGAQTHVWLSTAPEAGNVSGKFFIDPAVEYPGATREQLDQGGDWFLLTGKEFLAPQLRMPDRLYEWRSEANAKELWERSMEMIKPFKA